MCHRLLADLDGAAGDPDGHARAAEGYATALRIARSISDRAVLIEALLARGRWAAQLAGRGGFYARPIANAAKGGQAQGGQAQEGQAQEGQPQVGQPQEGQPQGLPLQQAFADLNEALGYAVEGGYRLYEADIRIGLAWAQRAAGSADAARQEAQRARTLSEKMGYHWGLVDAAEFVRA
jgi:hypothetical protein